MLRTCLGCSQSQSKSPQPQKTLETASNRALMILLTLKNVPKNKKLLIQRELRRRNKNNYGYELAKMFGSSPPPSNKWILEHANVKGRIAQESGMAKSIRRRIHPAHIGQFTRTPPKRVTDPQTRLYRITRKVKRAGLEHVLLPIISNRNPKIYKNTGWKYKAGPIAGDITILYNNRNSVPFVINKKTGKRRPVPEGLRVNQLELIPRNMNVNTLNAYSKRVNQLSKKFKSLQTSNDYATGRNKNKKPANSSMKFYFNTHPRALVTRARTPANIQRSIKESIQSNLFEYMPVPNRNNLRQKWETLTNMNQVNTLNNLVKKMRRYRRVAENTWEPHNAQTFVNMYNRALTRNKYGFYYR
jgi:hypothetical protein